MNKNQFSESKLYSWWNINGNKRYSVKKFIKKGKFVSHVVFKDKIEGRDVIGKVVGSFSEGEIFHWPNLHHQSLAPLLDIVSLPANACILITTYKEINLRQIVHDRNFVNNPSCFANKKIYMEDVLWGLDYLHRNSLVLMNISDAKIGICLESNKAVITDFSCLKPICRAKKCRFDLQPFYQEPEVSESNVDVQSKIETFNPIAAEMWAFGIMAFEVFLQHRVPWALVDYKSSSALEIMNYLDLDALRAANKGSILLHRDFIGFKEFLKLFLTYYPYNRCDARCAASAIFLKPSKNRMAKNNTWNWTQQKSERLKGKGDSFMRLNDEDGSRKGHYPMTSDCSHQENKCTERKEKVNSSVRLNNLLSIESSQIISKNYNKEETESAVGKLTKVSSAEMNGLSSTQNSNQLYASKHILTPKFSDLQNNKNCRKIDLNTGLSPKTSREHLPLAHSCSMYDKTHRYEKVSNIRKAHSSTYPNRNKSLDQQKVDDDLDNQILENMSDIQSLYSVSQQESTVSPLINRKIKSTRLQGIPEIESNLDHSTSGGLSNRCIEESRAHETFKSSFMNLSTDENLQSNDDEAAGEDAISQSEIYCSKSKSLYLKKFKYESCKSYISLRSSSSSKHNSNDQKKIKKSSVMFRSAPILGDFKNTSVGKKSDVSISAVSVKMRKSKKSWKSFVKNENELNQMDVYKSRSPEKDLAAENSTQNKEKTVSRTSFRQNQAFDLTGKWKRLPEPIIMGSFHCILKNRFHCPVHSKIKSSNSFQQSRDIEAKNSRDAVKCNKRTSLHLYKSGPLTNCYYSQISESTQPSPSRVEFSEKNKSVDFNAEHYKLSKRNSYKRAIHGTTDSLPDMMSTDRFSVNKTQNVERKRKKWVSKRCFIEIEVISQKSTQVRANNGRTMGTAAKDLQNEKELAEGSKQRKLKCHKAKRGKNTSLSPNADGNIMQTHSNVQANEGPNMGIVARQLKSEKTPENCSKRKKIRCHKVKAEKNIRLLPNGAGPASTTISTRSFAILTTESLNNPEVAETKDKRTHKRRSIKKAALYCLCLGNE